MNPTDVDMTKIGQLLAGMNDIITDIAPKLQSFQEQANGLPEEERAKVAAELSKINTTEILANIADTNKLLTDLANKCR
jgi:hypothetical protein